jgi:hypothetical protein
LSNHVRCEVPQCSKYQIKNVSFRQERCVKYAENYAIAKCPRKTRSDNIKSVLCNGNHPASYKESWVYKKW